METFTRAKPFILHPGYFSDRAKALRELDKEILNGSIDPPLLNLIRECNPITHFFTVQCCYSHFLSDMESDLENLIPPSQYLEQIETVRYRLAYLAICIQDTIPGREMYSDLEEMSADNPDYIQFGSAEWFWDRMVNTYCIQLEPVRFKSKDSEMIGIEEAMHIEKIRNDFFNHLAEIIHKHQKYPSQPS